VRSVLFFHVKGDATVTYQSLDWTFADDPARLAAVRDALDGWKR
jgi:hypothetical protein